MELTRAFDHATYCELVEAEGDRFITVATGLDPGARVPSCPEWTVTQLVEHMGGVHRWAGEHVARMSQVRLSWGDLGFAGPAGPEDFPTWLRSGVDELVQKLRAGDPDAEVWGWGADKHVRFWSRRMLHETTVHRADLEITAGTEPQIDIEVAADGIDELFENLPHARRFRPEVMSLRGEGETITFRAPDAARAWSVRLVQDGFEWDRTGTDDARVNVEAPATPLLLFIYGRETDASRGVTIDGDRDLLEFWRTNSAL